MQAVSSGRLRRAAPSPRVYYEIGYDDTTGQIYAPADDSFVAEMVTLAGADAITTGDPASYQIPLETLIERDPQSSSSARTRSTTRRPAMVLKRTGWERHDGGQGRARPARQRHRDHRVRVRGCRPVCAASPPPSSPTSTLPPAPRADGRASSRWPRDSDAGVPSSLPAPAARARRGRRSRRGLVVLLVLGVGLGSVRIGPLDTIGVILWRAFGIDLGAGPGRRRPRRSSWDLRLPRVLTAMVVGAGLAVAGATFQGAAAQPAGRSVRPRHRLRRRARGRDRRHAADPARRRRVRAAPRARVPGALDRRSSSSSGSEARRARRAHQAAADRLRGRLDPRGAA